LQRLIGGSIVPYPFVLAETTVFAVVRVARIAKIENQTLPLMTLIRLIATDENEKAKNQMLRVKAKSLVPFCETAIMTPAIVNCAQDF
jgi:hypothetical protein